MKRIIVDYTKVNDEVLSLLSQKFPIGFPIKEIIKFKTPKGENVEAVEIYTDDAIYLVKIGLKLKKAVEEHIKDNYEDLDDDENDDLDNEINSSDQINDSDVALSSEGG